MADGPAAALAARLEAAVDLSALQAVSREVDRLVRDAFGRGVPVAALMQQVSALDRRLCARAWGFVAPAALVARSCLLVMGSEGRGEQLLKTDQDNALLLPDDAGAGAWCADEPAAAAQRFTQALVDLGWPPCPGGVMVSNARWRQPLAAFRDTMRGWIYGADPAGPMHLAIFLDAVPLAGDVTLFEAARHHLAQIVDGADTFLARFAAAADAFAEPEPAGFLGALGPLGALASSASFGRLGRWLHRGHDHEDDADDDGAPPLDVKKLGTFPIVHGVRALALEHGVRATGTAPRLAALAEAGRLDAGEAAPLQETLHRLIGLRLGHQLRRLALGEAPDNRVRPAELTPAERRQLREALAVVGRFRAFLRRHYHLDAL